MAAWFQEDASGSRGRSPSLENATSPRAACDVLDLYCGTGIFALACAKAGARHVTGIEAQPAAITAANENASVQNIPATFLCQTLIEAALEKFNGLDLTHTTVIVDPPRQGLEPEVAQALAQAQPPRLCYVSCDPATLTRDLRILRPAGYAIRKARLFDMFPRTAHFETVVWLEHHT